MADETPNWLGCDYDDDDEVTADGAASPAGTADEAMADGAELAGDAAVDGAAHIPSSMPSSSSSPGTQPDAATQQDTALPEQQEDDDDDAPHGEPAAEAKPEAPIAAVSTATKTTSASRATIPEPSIPRASIPRAPTAATDPRATAAPAMPVAVTVSVAETLASPIPDAPEAAPAPTPTATPFQATPTQPTMTAVAGRPATTAAAISSPSTATPMQATATTVPWHAATTAAAMPAPARATTSATAGQSAPTAPPVPATTASRPVSASPRPGAPAAVAAAAAQRDPSTERTISRSRSTRTTSGRTALLADIGRRAAQAEFQSNKRNAVAPSPEAVGENPPPKKKRATKSSKATTGKAGAAKVSGSQATDKTGDATAPNQLSFHTKLQNRIAELEIMIATQKKKHSDELDSLREQCKRSISMFKKQNERGRAELVQKLEAAEKKAEQVSKAAARNETAVFPKSGVLNAAAETYACAPQEPAEEMSFSKAALTAAVTAALQGAEKKFRERERVLKASLLVAEVANSNAVMPDYLDACTQVYRTLDGALAERQPHDNAPRSAATRKAPSMRPAMCDAETQACENFVLKQPVVILPPPPVVDPVMLPKPAPAPAPVPSTVLSMVSPTAPNTTDSSGPRNYKTIEEKMAELQAAKNVQDPQSANVSQPTQPVLQPVAPQPAKPSQTKTPLYAPKSTAAVKVRLYAPKSQPQAAAVSTSTAPPGWNPLASLNRQRSVSAPACTQTSHKVCSVGTQVDRRSPRREACSASDSGSGSVQLQVSIVDRVGATVALCPAVRDEAPQGTASTVEASGSMEEPKRSAMVDAGTQVRCAVHDPDEHKKHNAQTQTLQHPAQSMGAQSTVAVTIAAHSEPMEGVQMSEIASGGASMRCRSEGPQESHGPNTATCTKEIGAVQDVVELAKLLSTTHAGTAVELGERSVSAPTSSSIGSETWRSVAMWPKQATITEQQATEGLLSLVDCTQQDEHICLVTGGRTKLSGGSLNLGSKGRYLRVSHPLLSSSTTGGVVVCHGNGCSVSFTDVTFNGCTVAVLDGASVTLTNCASAFDTAISQGLAVFASGRVTKVNMHGCSITGGTQGTTIQDGAHLEATGLRVVQVAVAGIEVKDPGSFLLLKHSTLKDFPDRHNELNIVCGLHIHDSAEANLTCVSIARMFCGVDMRASAVAILEFCSVESTVDCSVACTQGATGSMKSCTLSRSQSLHGLYVGAGSSMQAQHCNFLLHMKSGVCACNTGKLQLEDCICMGSKGSGFSVLGGASMQLVRCSSELDCQGCVVGDGGRLNASKCSVSRSEEIGIWIYEKGTAVLKECTVTACGHQGVVVAKPGAKMNMNSCRVDHTQRACVFVGEGAQAWLKGCTLANSVTCSGVASDGKGTEVNVEDCRLKQNAKYGALAGAQSFMSVKGCESRGNKLDGFMSHGHARMNAVGCSSNGDKSAQAGDLGMLCMQDCNFNAPSYHEAAVVAGVQTPTATKEADSRSRSMRRSLPAGPSTSPVGAIAPVAQ